MNNNIDFRTKKGRFFQIAANKKKKRFGVVLQDGRRKILKKECNICKFAAICEDEISLSCKHPLINNENLEIKVFDGGYCVLFDISKLMMEDIFTGCYNG